MTKKDFSFEYNLITKIGKMRIGKQYISLSAKSEATTKQRSIKSSSGATGYGLELIWRD